MALMLGSLTSGLFEGASAVLNLKEGMNKLEDWDTHHKASEAAASQGADALRDANQQKEYKPIDVTTRAPGSRPEVAPGGGATPGATTGDTIPQPKGTPATKLDTMPGTLPQLDTSGIPPIPGDPNAKPNEAPKPSWWQTPVSELVPSWAKPGQGQPSQDEPSSFPQTPPAGAPAAPASAVSPYPPTTMPSGKPTEVPPLDPNKPQVEQLQAMNIPQLQTLLSNPQGFSKPLILQELNAKRQAAIPPAPVDTNFSTSRTAASAPAQAAPPSGPVGPQPPPEPVTAEQPPASPGSGTVGASNAPAPNTVAAQTAGLVRPPGATPPSAPPQQLATAQAPPAPVAPSEAAPTGNMLTRALSSVGNAIVSPAQAAEPTGANLRKIAEDDKTQQASATPTTPPPAAGVPPASSRIDMTVKPQAPETPSGQPGGLGGATLGQPGSVTVPAATPAAIPPKGATAPATPASDPAAKPSPAQPAGPSVSTPSTTVAPGGQQGPTEKSEAAPRVNQPPMDTSAWEQVKQSRSPEVVAEIERIATKYGVSPERIAAHWKLESSLRGSIGNGTSGEIGVMQIMPGTRDMVDPKHTLDPNDFWDNMELGARVIAQCDARFGRDTVASAAAYNAGPGGAARMASGQGPASTYQYVSRMFHGEVSHDMYNTDGGSHTVNGAGIMKAGQEGGPDGMINYIAQTGAPNATLTDKWHAANYAIIKDAYRMGGTEGAQHAMDYITQMSHMGSNMALMSAYRAMSSGDMTTAAQQLARAHTFFPDGAVGQFGVDKQGNLWAQRVSERDQSIKIGPAFKVTREGIESMLVQTTDTNKYVATLSQMRANNQKVALEAARQKWYEGADGRAQIRADAGIAQRAIGGGGAGNANADRTDQRVTQQHIDSQVNTEFKVNPQLTDPGEINAARREAAIGSPIAHDLMTNRGLPIQTAAQYGRGLANGTYEMRPVSFPDGSKGAGIFRKGAAKDAKPEQTVSGSAADAVTRAAPEVHIVGGSLPSAIPQPKAKAG